MSLSPLLITEEITELIKNLIEIAKSNPITTETLMQIESGIYPDYSAFTIEIPLYYRVVYTHDIQPGDIECRHLSVSIFGKDSKAMPNPIAIKFLMKEFGFINELEKTIFWIEKCNEEGLQAVNIVEPVSGNMDDLKNTTKH